MRISAITRCLSLAAALLMMLMRPVPGLSQSLLTRPERTNYLETSRYDDVIRFLYEAKAQAQVDVMKIGFFGKTREGRALPVVILSSPAIAAPAQALTSGKPIVLLINNIHGGETDSKEAALMLIRDITQGKSVRWLDRIVLLVVPLYNADGNERIGKFNRMAQVGPEEGMGIRTNAAGYDLARDHMKQEQPEGQALASLFTSWWPHLTIDAHTNDGSYHGYTLTYAYPQNANVPPEITDYLRQTFLPAVSKAVEGASGYKSQVYGNFIDPNHPEMGWETFPSKPRYGDRYRGLQNRLSLLVESYPYVDFKTRVDATYQFFIGCLDYVSAHPDEITQVVRKAEARTVAQGNNPGPADSIGVQFKMTADDQPVQILSYKLREIKDPKGQKRYERTTDMTTYTMPYIGKSIATERVARPSAYIIPKAYAAIVQKLSGHGIAVEQLRQPLDVDVEVYRVTEMTPAADPYQGHREMHVTAKAEVRRMTLPPGTYVVPMGQPAGNVAAYLLEPETDDGYAAWNYFDNIVEQTVVIVNDFLDRVGEQVMQKPEVRAEFESRAKQDPALRTDLNKRREFLMEMSAYAAPDRFIFPIYRLMKRVPMATTLVNGIE